MGFGVLLNCDEREEFDVVLDVRVGPGSSDHTLSVEDGVGGVAGKLVLSSISDKTLTLLGEGNV